MSTPSATGIWLGTLSARSIKLRVQFHLDPATGACSIDSLDQGVKGIACSEFKAVGAEVSFVVPAIHARFHGILTADGNTLNGTWFQGTELPLTLSRKSEPLPVSTPKMDAAMPPAALGELQAVLDRDLAATISSGLLSPAQHGGVVIGVLQNGERLILAYGEGRSDGVYEIGSITKTFTGLLLAQMMEQGQVRLDTPVRELLPAGTVSKPASGKEITLLDLSTHRSGLPRIPENFRPADPKNPYVDYDAKRLYGFMQQHGVGVPPDTPSVYSNLGTGLLGQALANCAGMSYAKLLLEQITGPLDMKDTAIDLSPDLRARFVQGYDPEHNPASPWDMDALAGAGAIRSTAQDMLTYLEAQLRPDRLTPSVAARPRGNTLAAAITASHVIYSEAGPGLHIALNWYHNDSGTGYWHNGGTGGFSSFARFNPDRNYALIVMCNTAAYRFSDVLAAHISQRLEGKPAISLEK